MSSVLRTVKWFLLKNAHAKTESNSKRETVNILKMKRAALTDVLLVGLKKEFCDATREHHLEETKGRQIVQIDTIEKYTEKDKQHHENNLRPRGGRKLALQNGKVEGSEVGKNTALFLEAGVKSPLYVALCRDPPAREEREERRKDERQRGERERDRRER